MGLAWEQLVCCHAGNKFRAGRSGWLRPISWSCASWSVYALPMIEPNQSIGSALRSFFFFYFFFGSCTALLKELAPLNMFLVGSREQREGVRSGEK